MHHPVLDLVLAAEALPEQHSKLKRLIFQLRDSHSIRTDLSLAMDFVGTMRVLHSDAADDQVGGIAENSFLALFYSSLLLYARSTKTQHDHRISFDFRKEYDDEQKVKHDVLCDLRDKALAHYGPGGRYNGPAFQKDGVFIPYYAGTDGRIMTASHRLVIQPQLIVDLQQMVHRALMLAEKRTQTLNQKVTDMLNEGSKTDPELIPLLRKHIVDLSDFLGSKEAADEVMNGPRLGYQQGTARH